MRRNDGLARRLEEWADAVKEWRKDRKATRRLFEGKGKWLLTLETTNWWKTGTKFEDFMAYHQDDDEENDDDDIDDEESKDRDLHDDEYEDRWQPRKRELTEEHLLAPVPRETTTTMDLGEEDGT